MVRLCLFGSQKLAGMQLPSQSFAFACCLSRGKQVLSTCVLSSLRVVRSWYYTEKTAVHLCEFDVPSVCLVSTSSEQSNPSSLSWGLKEMHIKIRVVLKIRKKLKNGTCKALKSGAEYLMAFRHCPFLPAPAEACLK